MIPTYKSKTGQKVKALKIKTILKFDDGSARIFTDEPGYGSFEVSKWYMDNHQPREGGYYLIHETGKSTFMEEPKFKETYTHSFIWNLFAIVWGIEQYDKIKNLMSNT